MHLHICIYKIIFKIIQLLFYSNDVDVGHIKEWKIS